MKTEVTVWERGKAAPADLPTGRYTVYFAGNWTAIIVVRQAAELLLNKRLPFTGGDSLRLLSVTAIPYSNQSGMMILECDIEGAAWAILAGLGLILGIGIFSYLTMTKVTRAVEIGGPASSILLILAIVGVVGIGGYALVRSK